MVRFAAVTGSHYVVMLMLSTSLTLGPAEALLAVWVKSATVLHLHLHVVSRHDRASFLLKLSMCNSNSLEIYQTVSLSWKSCCTFEGWIPTICLPQLFLAPPHASTHMGPAVSAVHLSMSQLNESSTTPRRNELSLRAKDEKEGRLILDVE